MTSSPWDNVGVKDTFLIPLKSKGEILKEELIEELYLYLKRNRGVPKNTLTAMLGCSAPTLNNLSQKRERCLGLENLISCASNVGINLTLKVERNNEG